MGSHRVGHDWSNLACMHIKVWLSCNILRILTHAVCHVSTITVSHSTVSSPEKNHLFNPNFMPQNSGQIWTFYHFLFYICSFPNCHITGISQLIAFSEWLLSLKTMHLRFLHVLSCLDSSFFFKSVSSIPAYGCSAVSLFANWSDLGCFQSWQ